MKHRTHWLGSFLLVIIFALPSSAEAVTAWALNPKIGQPVVIEFRNFPGNKQDWISVMRVGQPDNTYHRGYWSYTKGQHSGRITLGKLDAGQYEVRGYLNWPTGGYQVVSRSRFTIENRPKTDRPEQGGGISVMALTLLPNTPITIKFDGLPGNKQDWISIMPAEKPDNSYRNGYWAYTKGQSSGQVTFGTLSPGNYEIRVYLDWPTGGYNVVTRRFFTIYDNDER